MDDEQLTYPEEQTNGAAQSDGQPMDAGQHGSPSSATPEVPVTETPTAELTDNASPARHSRRRFLAGAAGGLAALVAAACGRSRSTPTPSPLPTITPTPTGTQVGSSSLLPTQSGYQSHLPWISNNRAQIAYLPPEPTMTPTPPKIPTATRTPEPPTPTPTPQATPFPPGPPSKLGLFVARNHPQIFDLLKTQAVPVL